ncbi:MAG: KGG domain-containing protein [Luteolibacter sp.]
MSNKDSKSGGSERGFAAMDENKQREIASEGGRAAHESGNAHEFDSEEAREAGRKAHESGNAHEFTSEEAREAGKKGGSQRGNQSQSSGNQGGGQRGGSSEQHAKAGSQSHKND